MLNVAIRKKFLAETGKFQAIEYRFQCQMNVGELHAVIGATGIGKSTFFQLLAGLIGLDQGLIEFQGQPIQQFLPHQRPLSYLFQDENLIAHLTVQQNIFIGFPNKVVACQSFRQQLADLLEQCALTPLLKRYPNQISGGQNQLVGLVRSLLRSRILWKNHYTHTLLLLDEPFNGLDPTILEISKKLLLAEKQQYSPLIIYSSHDWDLVKNFSDHVWKIQPSATQEQVVEMLALDTAGLGKNLTAG